MRPAIATVVGLGWEPRLAEHARSTGKARLIGRCADPESLFDVAGRADAVFLGSDVPWLGLLDVARLSDRTRLIGVASDPPGARLLSAAGIDEVIGSGTPPDGMLALVTTTTPPPPGGRVIEVTGPRGAPGRSEVALALAMAGEDSGRAALVELDFDAPSLGLRMGIPPRDGGEDLPIGGRLSLVPAPAGLDPICQDVAVGLIRASAATHGLTVVDGGPCSEWHRVTDVDDVVVVGEASDVGVVRLARLLATWTGPVPLLIINRHHPGQDMGQVLAATGLEPIAVIPETRNGRRGVVDREICRPLRRLLQPAEAAR